MSEYNSVAPPQQFNKSQAFAAALQRAKQIAAKINPGASSGGEGGVKRLLDEGSEPDTKKLAASPPPGALRHSPQTMVPSLTGGIYTEEIKVPDKMVGLIIGRGGEQITSLQSESGCKIQMAPDSGGAQDRICTLTGNHQAIIRAKELVNGIVNSYKGEGDTPRSDIMPSGPPQLPTVHNPSFVEIMLPGAKVGLVIGKGGETIKQLQEKSGAKMVVIQEGPNQEAEKPLRITGDPQKVEHAKALVYELLAEKENQFQARGGMNRGGGGGRGGFGGGRGSFGQQRGGEEDQYIVPSNKCGVIIGRGGETIKQINQATGAHCELDRRPNDNPNEKIFLIRGTPEQIEAAKQMIAEKLGQGPPGQGGFQPQQQWGGMPQQPYQPPYNQQPAVDPNFAGGAMPNMAATPQADYSQQWIEYYRSLGLHNEADAIEQQIKAKQAAQAAAAVQQPQPTPQPQENGSAPDYSAQWAQYYRSLGKIKEAESIENQMKAKQQAQQGGAPPSGAPQPGPPVGAPQFANYYPGGGFYPGYQYPAGPYPGYGPAPQCPAPGEAQQQSAPQK